MSNTSYNTTLMLGQDDERDIKHYPYPYSVIGLPQDIRDGIIPIAITALLSVFATLSIITFIVWRLITWRMHYRTFIGNNQYVMLVLQLLIADMQQAAAYLISFHWLNIDAIIAPSSACTAQAWLLHSGDVSSAFFVLAIALHTFYTAVHGQRLSYRAFLYGIAGIWATAYFLALVGIIIHGRHYYTRAGAWCWVSPQFEIDRLMTHYIWLFLVQFSIVVIYCITYITLRMRTRSLFAGYTGSGRQPANVATIKAVDRIAKLMTAYPIIYIALTMPLSAARMWEMQNKGQAISTEFQCAAGALLCSCGWIDSLLYTLTRKRLLQETMPENAPSGRRGTRSSGEPLSGITHTRTVTITEEDGFEMDV